MTGKAGKEDVVMKVIETNTETMNNDVRSVGDMIGELSRDVADLTQCAGRISAMWQGDANKVFGDELRAQLSDLNDLVTTLKDLNSGTDSARKRYVDCEANVSHIIDSINV